MKTIHCKMKAHTQNEDNALKHKVNEATLLPLALKTKITATEALDGKKIFFTLGKSKKNFKLWRGLNYTIIRKQMFCSRDSYKGS